MAFSFPPRFRFSPRRWLRPALTVLFLGLGLWFVRHEGPELGQALRQLPETPFRVGLLAAGVTGLYLMCCGLMYVGGFRAGGGRVPLGEATRLWLRRNFLSVFLPAGGVSSLAFYNRSLRRATPARPALTDRAIYAGSLVYLVAGYGSLLLVALPVLTLGLGEGLLGNGGISWALLPLLVGIVLGVVGSFRQKGAVYRLMRRFAPRFLEKLEPFFAESLAWRPVGLALLASVGVEACGVAHVALAIWAVGGAPTFTLSLIAYVVATLFFALSPVMRGLGAVEASMTVVLVQLGGLSLPVALAATLYYRLFEFWLPLVLGLVGLVGQRGNLLLRVLPAFLTLVLGVVNLLSALTPALRHRLRLLEGLLPLPVIEASNALVLATGGVLVLLSIGLLRGYRPAWTGAVGLVSLSMVTHLTKAFDYEETLFAAGVLGVLLYTRPQYRLAAPPLRRLARVPVGSRSDLPPGLADTTPDVRETARALVARHGRSALDYFKTYPDKELLLLPNQDAFVAYRRAGRFAVVLEGPVGPPGRLADCVRAFDARCGQRGYQALYYRVDADELPTFLSLGKKALKIGQEGLVDLPTFSLEGRDRKSLRNALKRVEGGGFAVKIHEPPLRDGFLQQLRAVSDAWLRAEDLAETVFSQGVFRETELKQQTVLTVENGEGKVVAFANVIPDPAPGEGTYDLIRKTPDAPSGVSDALLVGLIHYGQERGWQTLNLGLAPLSGLDGAGRVTEQAIHLAYERIRAFAHLKGLRAFKEKYATAWRDKYLVYGEDLDLVQASVALQQVGRYREAE